VTNETGESLTARYELADLPGQEMYPDPVELKPDEAKIRLFSYLTETLVELAGDRPLLLIIDDLQWADELTLGFFEFILRARHLEKSPILFVGTYRSEAVGEELKKVLDRVEQVDLARLNQEGVSIMVSDMLAMRPAPQLFCRYLSRHSEGNPFFVAEYLRTAVEEELLYRDRLGNWQVDAAADETLTSEEKYEMLPLPMSLKGLIERRLSGLSERSSALIEAAATVGREAHVHLLREMIRVDEEVLTDTIEELMHHQVLEQSAQDSVRFAHDKIREISYARLGGSEKQRLHALAAKSIEEMLPETRAEYLAELGRHWEVAGEKEKARVCHLAAARRGRDRYDNREAERLYRAYLSLVTNETGESLTARYELADLLDISGQYDAALFEYEAVIEQTDNTGLKAQCTRNKGTILASQGDVSGARQLFQEALNLSESIPLEQARILNKMAYFEGVTQSNYQDAENLCHKAFDQVLSRYPVWRGSFPETSPQPTNLADVPLEARKIMAETSRNIGIVYINSGDFDRALEFFQRSLAICEEIGDKQGNAITANSIGIVYHIRGEFHRSLEFLQKSRTINEEIGNKSGLGAASCNMGLVYHSLSDLDKALESYQTSYLIYQEIGKKTGIGDASGNMGLLYLALDDLERALEYFQKSLEIRLEIGNKKGIGVASNNIGNVYHARGDLDLAREFFQKYRAISQEIGNKEGIGIATANIGSICRERDELDQALEYYQKALSLCREIGDKSVEAQILLELSEIYRFKNDLERALKLNSQAREIFMEAGNILKVGDSWCRKAECDIDCRDFSAAHQALTKAQEIYSRNKGGKLMWRMPLIRMRLAISELSNEISAPQPEEIEQVVEQTRQLGEEADNSSEYGFKIESYHLLGVALKLKGLLPEAQNKLEQAFELAQKVSYNLLGRQVAKDLQELV
ncbi:tetratricopeptide repeat protein, partial [candidate division CSSED10-310 bacterium]